MYSFMAQFLNQSSTTTSITPVSYTFGTVPENEGASRLSSLLYRLNKLFTSASISFPEHPNGGKLETQSIWFIETCSSSTAAPSKCTASILLLVSLSVIFTGCSLL